MIALPDLLNINIFRDFLQEDLEKIFPSLTERTFSSEEMIIFRGDPGYSLFLILSGTVAVTLINDEGIEYTINTQGPGDNFGEMALMTGEPRSANVKAVTDVRLAELSQEAFFELLSNFPKLGDDFLHQLAQRRGKTLARQHFADLERAEIIATLFAQQPPDINCFLGKSSWTKETNDSIDRIANSTTNILILGERGTGKDLAARLIHFHSAAGSRPLFHLDCANPPPIQRKSVTEKANNADECHQEIAQESALFGHAADAGSFARGFRKGYLELANGGTVILENIESMTAHVQQLFKQYLKGGTFARLGESRQIYSKTRLIATSTRTLEELNTRGVLDPELLPLFNAEFLQMKPLRERKKDIPVLAEHLVQEYNKKFAKKVIGFSNEALNLMVDHEWPLNVDEMHQVLERAIVVADAETIMESQLFLNIPTFSTTGKFNLLKVPFIRELANLDSFPAGLRIVTFPFIIGLILLTLLGPTQNNPANLVVWAIWWPFLIFSIIFGARSWCGYCPMPVLSDGVNYFKKRFHSVPDILAKYGLWIGIAGFALILTAEHATHMFTEARATSVLLICILAGTTMTNFIFGKRSWCKYFCPLGRMVSSSTAVSLIELGSNSNVCSSQCHNHDCVKAGNCPMGIHPATAVISKDCILCLSCLKRCKHQSVRIDLRFPWYELSAREKWNAAEAFFAVLLTALVLALKLPSWGPLADLAKHQMFNGSGIGDVSLSVLIGVLYIFIFVAASGFFTEDSWKKNFAILGSAYLFLAFSGFFNIYFHEFVYHGGNLLPWIQEMAGFGTIIPNEWITPELGTLKAVIPMVTLLSSTASFLLLTRLHRKYSLSRFVLLAHRGMIIITTLIFLVIL
ncbi:MAG: sigma 54-interacting transcriptional regulator [Candidatus Riflebacteria bacterium]|nr:sigma 54-interacting transcriptional regulator [Candidatus Riflebacteria bacterium]